MLSAGADVNATASEEDNNGGVLGEIINCYHQPENMSDDSMYEWNTLKYLPQVIDIFLKHGFDVNRKNGETGGMCLYNLLLSAKDLYVLDALALCLYWEKDIWNLSVSGLRFTSGILLEKENSFSRKNCFRDMLVLQCEDIRLCVSQYVDLFVDNGVRTEDVKRSKNVDCFFPNCIGQFITAISIDYKDNYVGNTNYGQPVVLLFLGNGKTIRFSFNHGDVPRNEITAYFDIL